jgi:formylglycine-generating enzyme required for sulfatase activity
MRTNLMRSCRWAVAAIVVAIAMGPREGDAQATAQLSTPKETRVALVIGIGGYQNAPKLQNPLNDARRMSDALRRLGFDVEEQLDPDFRTFSRALRQFGIKAQQADAALVYYAGHGVQVDRQNYLLPVDAKLQRERDLLYEAMPLELILGETASAQKVGIVLLDACRNNPFSDRLSRSVIAGRATSQKGLARVDQVPSNTIVVTATRADQIAEDGSGENSPFTEAILAHLQIPGLELSLFFRSVRDTVLRATGNRQEPYIFSSLGAEPWYFYPRPPNRAPELQPIGALEVSDAAGPTPLGIARPLDPDQDPLTVRVTGLPRSGEVRAGERVLALNDVIPLDRFMGVTYKPDGKLTGSVGTFDFLVEDGRGGTVLGVLPIAVLSSNRPPVAEGPRKVVVYPGTLAMLPPSDPDGDPVVATITSLPGRGVVRNSNGVVRVGDRLRPSDLAELTFTPEPGAAGETGALRYVVEDGRGGKAEGRIDIEVAKADDVTSLVSETTLWNRVREGGSVEDVDAFIRLFRFSRLAPEAQSHRDHLASARSPGPSPASADASGRAPPTPRPAAADARNEPSQPMAGASEPSRQSAATSSPPASTPPQATATPPPAAPAPGPTSPAKPPAPAAETNIAAISPPAVPPTGGRGSKTDGATFRDCPDCPSMIRVPGGSFTMGVASGDPSAAPAHRVTVRPFALGQVPVTVAEWKACMDGGGCRSLPRMAIAEERTPLHGASWDDTQQYVAWLSTKTGRKYRLPSEAEWEYAARANSTTRYWWGDDVGVALANCADCGGNQDKRGPLPVGSFKPNAFGLLDMLGGVAQWVQDCSTPNYQGAPTDGSAREQKNCTKRVLRGGSFRSDRTMISTTARNNYDASVRYITNGFRVARDLD